MQNSVKSDKNIALKGWYLNKNSTNQQTNISNHMLPTFLLHNKEKLAADLTSSKQHETPGARVSTQACTGWKWGMHWGIHEPQLLCLLRVCFNGHGPLNCLLWIPAHFYSSVCRLGIGLLPPNFMTLLTNKCLVAKNTVWDFKGTPSDNLGKRDLKD